MSEPALPWPIIIDGHRYVADPWCPGVLRRITNICGVDHVHVRNGQRAQETPIARVLSVYLQRCPTWNEV